MRPKHHPPGVDAHGVDELVTTFLLVARLGSFSAAAKELGLSGSTVSRRVEALESRIGSRLVRVQGPRFDLSDDGRFLLKNCAPAHEGLQRAWERGLAALSKTSWLIVGATGAGVFAELPGVMAEWRAATDHAIPYRLYRASAREMAGLVQRQRVRIGIGRHDPMNKQVCAKPYKGSRLVAAYSRETALPDGASLSDIDELGWTVPPGRSAGVQLLTDALGHDPSIRLQVDGYEECVRYAHREHTAVLASELYFRAMPSAWRFGDVSAIPEAHRVFRGAVMWLPGELGKAEYPGLKEWEALFVKIFLDHAGRGFPVAP